MNAEPFALETLLDRLGAGADAAAAQAFQADAPDLRVVVRSQLSDHLRAKFDSLDIVRNAPPRKAAGNREPCGCDNPSCVSAFSPPRPVR